MAISELEKPKDHWCTHCAIGEGCKIYDRRPAECRDFNCAYLVWDRLPEHWYPAKCRMVVAFELEGRRIAVHSDPARPDAWRQSPYFEEMKQLTAGGTVQVVVYVGARAIVVLPDREIDLGVCSEEDRIVTYQRMGPHGAEWHAEKLHKDDPRFAA